MNDLSPVVSDANPDFVSPDGTDLCVICGTDTGIRTTTHIDLRPHYFEGCGQCCKQCAGGMLT